jgi:hypothetical protein
MPGKTGEKELKPVTRKSTTNMSVVAIPLINSLRGLDAVFPPTAQQLHRRRIGIAHHEAAHVFAAHHFGFSLKQNGAEIAADGTGGLTHFLGEDIRFDGSSQARARAEEAIVLLLAGGAAHRKLSGDTDAGGYLIEGDDKSAKDIIEALTPTLHDKDLPWFENPYPWGAMGGETERTAYLKVLRYRADRLVSENWAIIHRVAKTLLASKSLTAKQIQRIITKTAA